MSHKFQTYKEYTEYINRELKAELSESSTITQLVDSEGNPISLNDVVAIKGNHTYHTIDILDVDSHGNYKCTAIKGNSESYQPLNKLTVIGYLEGNKIIPYTNEEE